MPLPIETPAPKASSLIKRFQQTIDSVDGNQSLPLPDSSLKQAPQQTSQSRRSASAGTPQLVRSSQLGSLNRSSWNPPTEFSKPTATNHSRPHTAGTPGQKEPAAFMINDHPTVPHHESPNPLMSNQLQEEPIQQTLRNSVKSVLELPSAPPIDHPSDLSRLSDLCKSDLAVQSPISSSKTNPFPMLSSQPKLKAPISAEAAPRSRKVTNNITAPTAASLAKMRDTQVTRSNSQTSVSNARTGSAKAPSRPHAAARLPKSSSEQIITKARGSPKVTASTKVGGSPNASGATKVGSSPKVSAPTKVGSSPKVSASTKLGGSPRLAAVHDSATGTAAVRQARSSANAPKERARMQQVRPSTPATSDAMRRSVMAKTKVPPLPIAADKASSVRTSSPMVQATSRRIVAADPLKPIQLDPRSESAAAVNKPVQRPLERARVASAATPISGVKKSTCLKPTTQASGKPLEIAQPISASVRRSSDLKIANGRSRQVVKQAPTSTKSSKPNTMDFPDALSTDNREKSMAKTQEGNFPASTGKELALQCTNEDHVKAQLIDELGLEIHFQQDQAQKESHSISSDEVSEDQVNLEEEQKPNCQVEDQGMNLEKSEARDEVEQTEPIFHDVKERKRVVGLIDSIVLEAAQVPQQSEEFLANPINETETQAFETHSGIGLNSKGDFSKADFDPSTTPNRNYVQRPMVDETGLGILPQQEKENSSVNSDESSEDQIKPKEEPKQHHQVEEQEMNMEKPEASDEEKKTEPSVYDVNEQKRVVGLMDSIVLEPAQVPQQPQEFLTSQIHKAEIQSFEKHSTHLSLSGISLNSEDDHFKADFDASTTTNTDIEE